MKKENNQTTGHSFCRKGFLVAATSLFLLGACEAKKPADPEAEARDDAADAAKDAKRNRTTDSTGTTSYLEGTLSKLV